MLADHGVQARHAIQALYDASLVSTLVSTEGRPRRAVQSSSAQQEINGPQYFDARDGLPTEVLQGLRGANRVVLALKDRNTAALGYWIKTQRPDQQDTEEFRLVILRAKASPTHGHEVSEEQPLTIGAAQDDLLWQDALRHLHPGDVAIVYWAVGLAAVSLTVSKHTPKQTGPWGFGDYRKWTVPLARLQLWPDGPRPTPNFVPTYFLGHTTNKRRLRAGQPFRGVRPA